jgi:hypothetical protein
MTVSKESFLVPCIRQLFVFRQLFAPAVRPSKHVFWPHSIRESLNHFVVDMLVSRAQHLLQEEGQHVTTSMQPIEIQSMSEGMIRSQQEVDSASELQAHQATTEVYNYLQRFFRLLIIADLLFKTMSTFSTLLGHWI